MLLLFSLLFYAWGEPYYVFVMVFSILSGYVFGRLIEKYRGGNAESCFEVTPKSQTIF